MGKKLIMHWNRLPMEVVESLSMEVYKKKKVDMALRYICVHV